MEMKPEANLYIQSGDESGIEALAPMIAQDSAALAIRNGETTAQDLANGGLAAALGFEPSEAMLAAAMEAPAPAGAPAPVEVQRSSFAFDKPGAASPTAHPAAAPARGPSASPFAQVGRDRALAAASALSAPRSGSFTNGTQTGAPGGYVAKKSGEALARSVGLPMAFVNAQQGAGEQTA